MKKIAVILSAVIISLVLLSCGSGTKGTTGPSGPTGPASIMFRQGSLPTSTFAGAYDTFLYAYSSSTNYGTAASGYAGDAGGAEHMAIQYVINGGYLPSTAIVSSAYLTMYCSSAGTPGNVIAYSLNEPWLEGSDTWNSLSVAGGSLSASPISAAVNVTAPGYYDFKLDNSIVQGWLNGTGSSYGVVLRSQTESGSQPDVVFQTKESATVLYRPMLTIYYNLP
jgi:hypothetical protein